MPHCLLDTHTLIWFFNGDEQLSLPARQYIENEQNIKFASIVSVWELAIKIGLKKLHFADGPEGFVNLIHQNGFRLLNIEPKYVYELGKLEYHHRAI